MLPELDIAKLQRVTGPQGYVFELRDPRFTAEKDSVRLVGRTERSVGTAYDQLMRAKRRPDFRAWIETLEFHFLAPELVTVDQVPVKFLKGAYDRRRQLRVSQGCNLLQKVPEYMYRKVVAESEFLYVPKPDNSATTDPNPSATDNLSTAD